MDKTIAVYPDNHEAEMCYGGEAARQENINGCTKNPGHKDFVPLKNFTINCLPSRYHDNDLMFETIKAMATLTIQVKTKFTSLERPEFYPGTQVPYPCYKDRGSHVMRLGTGRVCQIFKYTERDGICYCVDCQVSAIPNKVYGVLGILTAKHVVFDDSEARQTTCVLGFDDDESHVTRLTGWTVEEADVEKDRCWLNYVTCDLDFIDELVTKWRHFEDLCREMNKLYGRFADVDKLTVIVSHGLLMSTS